MSTSPGEQLEHRGIAKQKILQFFQCMPIVASLQRLQHLILQLLSFLEMFQSDQDSNTIRIHDSRYTIVVFEQLSLYVVPE